jgi:hypothetical protein
MSIPDGQKEMLIAGLDLGDNAAFENFTKPAAARHLDTVIAEIVDKVAQNQLLTSGEAEIYKQYSKIQHKLSEFAPKSKKPSGIPTRSELDAAIAALGG